MYSGGYRSGQRLAAFPIKNYRSETERTTDPRLIGLGFNDYAEGFEDGHHGAPPPADIQLPLLDLESTFCRVVGSPEPWLSPIGAVL